MEPTGLDPKQQSFALLKVVSFWYILTYWYWFEGTITLYCSRLQGFLWPMCPFLCLVVCSTVAWIFWGWRNSWNTLNLWALSLELIVLAFWTKRVSYFGHGFSTICGNAGMLVSIHSPSLTWNYTREIIASYVVFHGLTIIEARLRCSFV